MSLQGKEKWTIHPFVWIILIIIFINIIMAFPILIVILAILLFNWKINIEKILKISGINNFLKKQFWANYEKIISDITKSKKYKNRVRNNRNKREEVEDLFTDKMWKQLDDEYIDNYKKSENRTTIKREDKFNKMQQDFEDKQNQEKILYQQNQKVLQEKFAKSSKQKKSENKTRDSFTSYRSTQRSNNFFWNNKTSDSFWEWKSIWDNYESVTDKFSSNNK